MKLTLRPSLDHEWRDCRMLLPETFADLAGREYLVCVSPEIPFVMAAASFRRAPGVISHLRLHVIPPLRRQGLASHIVAWLGSENELAGTAEIMEEPAAGPFCRKNDFQNTDSLTTVEAAIAEMREYTGRLRTRIGLPGGIEIVALAQAPFEQVARLHAEQVAATAEFGSWRARLADSPGLIHSPVAMIDGRVAGMLLWEPIGGMAVVRSRVVAPAYRRTVVNTLLLAEALDGAWTAGTRRVRFSYTNAGRDTQKLATRFRATVTSVTARFVRPMKSVTCP